MGRKIGLTSPAAQQQLGVNQPDFGVLFHDMDVSETPVAQRPRLLQPKVEAEPAFLLRADLDGNRLDATTVRGAGSACLGDPLNALAWPARTS